MRLRWSAGGLLLVLLALGLTACDTLLPDTFVGRYALESIDGTALPYVMAASETTTIEALDGYLQADNDNTFVFSMTLRTQEVGADDAVDTIESGGFWSQTSEGVTLIDADGKHVTTDFQDGALTFTTSGRTYRLRR